MRVITGRAGQSTNQLQSVPSQLSGCDSCVLLLKTNLFPSIDKDKNFNVWLTWYVLYNNLTTARTLGMNTSKKSKKQKNENLIKKKFFVHLIVEASKLFKMAYEQNNNNKNKKGTQLKKDVQILNESIYTAGSRVKENPSKINVYF